MAIGVVISETSVAVKEEVTTGTYVPEAAGSDFVEILADGLEFTPTKELIDRNILTNSTEMVAARTGTRGVSGSIPVEYKSDGVAGDKPETDALYKSLLGDVRSGALSTTTTGNTSTVLTFASHTLAVGDIALVKETGAFELRPVSATTATTVTFPFALLNGAPSDTVVVEAFTTYFIDSGSSPSLSVTRYIGGEVREKNIGMRCTSGSLENFTTGQISSVNFGLEGLDFDREDGEPLFTPSFDTAQPPITLSACIFINGTQRDMNSASWSIENELGFITSTCSDNGKIDSRITKVNVTGSLDPYMDDADADSVFTDFRDNEDVSIFGFALNPSVGSTINATTGIPTAFEDIVAFWIPQAKETELSTGDQEGIATNAITFQANRNLGNDTIFLGFI